MRAIQLAALFLIAGCAGCDSPPTTQTSDAKKATGPLAPPPVEAPPGNPAAPEKPAAPPTERVKAEVGVGKKGRRLDQPHVIQAIAAPAKSLFAVRERAVFEIQIPSAMNLYRAEHGNYPKTHEEFMTKIVKANQLQLPELPAGHKYVYDPERAELMVEKPKGS